jgi:hypothetical protein
MNRFTFGNVRGSCFVISIAQLSDSELKNHGTDNVGQMPLHLVYFFISLSKGDITKNDTEFSYTLRRYRKFP